MQYADVLTCERGARDADLVHISWAHLVQAWDQVAAQPVLLGGVSHPGREEVAVPLWDKVRATVRDRVRARVGLG
jgi:hypothetical protein